MFRKMISKIAKAGKTCIVFGTVYFAGCYMYLQQINYRIGQANISQDYLRHLQKIQTQKQDLQQKHTIQYSSQDRSFERFVIQLYVNWNRIWHYRQYEEDCKILTKGLIAPILQNYQSNGIFQKQEAIEKSIKKHKINDNLLKEIFKIKEQNSEVSEHYTFLLQKVKLLQLLMNTQKVISLQSESKQKIDLLYQFIFDQIKIMRPALTKMDPQSMKLQNQIEILNGIDPNDIISKLTLL